MLVEIEAKAGEDESEERHQDGDGHRAAVGTELRGRRVLTLGHVQTCRGKDKNITIFCRVGLNDPKKATVSNSSVVGVSNSNNAKYSTFCTRGPFNDGRPYTTEPPLVRMWKIQALLKHFIFDKSSFNNCSR